MAAGTSGTSEIAERYATALYQMADEAGQLDAVAEDLRGLRKLMSESADLRRFVRSPIYGRATQTRAILAVLEAAKVADLTRRFVGVIGENRRLAALPAMIDAFLETLARRRGEVTAKVSSAASLSEAQLGSLTEALRAAVGSKVVVETDVDPGLIGGLVVRVGSRMFDASLRTKLQKMQLAMKGVG